MDPSRPRVTTPAPDSPATPAAPPGHAAAATPANQPTADPPTAADSSTGPIPAGDVTAGPAPPVADIRVAVRRLLATAEQRGLLGTGVVAVACSGGADSLALAAAVGHEGRHRGLTVHGLVVDHGLQAGSAEVAARAAGQLRALGYPLVDVLTPEVAGPGGPEAAARRARYEALRSARPSDSLVFLGHTLDDQAETVLLGLGRGSGPRSMSGMRPLDPPWARPLLGVTRSTTRQACAALGLDPWSDPHNTDPRFTRVRLRNEVLPLLEDVLQGGVAAALGRTAAQLAEDGAALDELAAAALDRADPRESGGEPAHSVGPGRDIGVKPPTRDAQPADTTDWVGEVRAELLVTPFDAVHPAIRRRALRRWLLDGGVPALSDLQLRSVDALVGNWRGQGPVTLRFGLVVVRSHGRLQLKLAKRTEGK